MTTPVSHKPYALNTTQFIDRQQVVIDHDTLMPFLEDATWEDFMAYNPLKQGFYRPTSMPRAQAFNAFFLGVPSCIQQARATAFTRLKTLGLLPDNAYIDPLCYFSLLRPEDRMVEHDDTGRIESGNDVMHVAFTVMLYLNDIQGGALNLPDAGETVPAKAGNMVIFSADVKHGVEPIRSDKRYAVMFRIYEVEPRDQ